MQIRYIHVISVGIPEQGVSGQALAMYYIINFFNSGEKYKMSKMGIDTTLRSDGAYWEDSKSMHSRCNFYGR